MQLNPNAIAMWLFTTGVGFLATGTVYGAVCGAVVGFGITLLATFLS